jgi:hypothetical protein
MSAGAGPEVADSDVVTGFTTTYLWGDTVWVGLINERQNQNEPTFARSFNWTAETGGQERQIRQYRARTKAAKATGSSARKRSANRSSSPTPAR